MTEPRYTDYDHGITAIDTDYVRPALDASHLLVRDGRAAFVDTGTTLSVPHLLATLERKGITREQVDYVLVTHVHLDHAGGAGTLMQELPNARLVVHPRGARHLIDPERLIQGSIAVYGEEAFHRLYGEVVPVPAERVIEAADRQRVELGGSELELIYTEGHARHHYCIVDRASGGVFTGDSFGISYRELDTERGAFIYPTTTPVHFDPEAAHAAVDRIQSYRPEALYLTHYSRVSGCERLGEDMHQELNAFVAIARRHAEAPEDERVARIAQDLRVHLREQAQAHGVQLPAERIDELIAMDVDLNAQGLAVWLDRAG